MTNRETDRSDLNNTPETVEILDFEVKILEVPGKIGRFTKGGTTYVRYVAGHIYHPNENYLEYFGDVELLELKAGVKRSSSIREA